MEGLAVPRAKAGGQQSATATSREWCATLKHHEHQEKCKKGTAVRGGGGTPGLYKWTAHVRDTNMLFITNLSLLPR